jgi:hypothetical protein
LAPRKDTSELGMMQAKIAHDTQYMYLIAYIDPKIWCFDDLNCIDSISRRMASHFSRCYGD